MNTKQLQRLTGAKVIELTRTPVCVICAGAHDSEDHTPCIYCDGAHATGAHDWAREAREADVELWKADRQAHLTAQAVASLGFAQPTSALTATPASTYTTESLLADYVAARKARHRSAGTLSFYDGLKKPLLRHLPPLARDITHKQLLAYIATRRAEIQKRTSRDDGGERVRKELHSFLKPALKLAKKSKLFADDPRDVVPDMDSLAKPRERSLTVHEVWAIIRFLEKRSDAGRDHAACFAWSQATGAEHAAWSRAMAKDLRDDLRGCQIHGTKNAHRDRFAPTLVPMQRDLLAYARKHAAGTDGRLFRDWSVTNSNSDLKEACKALGLEPCSTHDARRTYQETCLDAGVRDSLIDAALGHKPSGVLLEHYRKGKMAPERLLSLFEADIRAHAKSETLDDPNSVAQGAPVQPVSDVRSKRKKATDNADRAKDGPIAQSVELRTFNP